MSPAVEKLLSDFEHLSIDEKYEAVLEVIRRSNAPILDEMTDEMLTAIAEERFLELEAEERNASASAG